MWIENKLKINSTYLLICVYLCNYILSVLKENYQKILNILIYLKFSFLNVTTPIKRRIWIIHILVLLSFNFWKLKHD